MGVTIHFEGQLKSAKDYDELVEVAKNFAIDNDMPYSFFAEADKILQRVRDEEEWDYQGPVKGIKIQPDENSDPLWLEFDKNLYVQDFCKTQFAGIGIHVKIIELLEKIEFFFQEIIVFDEGEFWKTHNIIELEKHLEWCFEAMANYKKENPEVEGPFKLKDGRIADLM